jgi:hypothetical protein
LKFLNNFKKNLDVDNDVLYDLAKAQYEICYIPIYTKKTNTDQLGGF